MKCKVSEVASGTVGLPQELAEQLGDHGELDVERVAEGLLLRTAPAAESAERYAERWAAYVDWLPAAIGFTKSELRELRRGQERTQVGRGERVVNR
jgi:hypothetical protein